MSEFDTLPVHNKM